MKLTHSSAIILAVAASQALAVTPIPAPGCTKQVVVDPKYDSCIDFARDYDLTFADLLKMNDKLGKDCMNLDVGEKMCVSVNPGGVNPPLVDKEKKDPQDSKDSKKKPVDGTPAVVPGGAKAPDSKIAPVRKSPVVVVTAPLPATPAHAPPPAGVVAPVPGSTGKTDEKKDVAKNVHSSAAAVSARASLAVVAAGTLLSLAYLL